MVAFLTLSTVYLEGLGPWPFSEKCSQGFWDGRAIVNRLVTANLNLNYFMQDVYSIIDRSQRALVSGVPRPDTAMFQAQII